MCSQVRPQQIGFSIPQPFIASKWPRLPQLWQIHSPSVSSAHTGQRSPKQSSEYGQLRRQRAQGFWFSFFTDGSLTSIVEMVCTDFGSILVCSDNWSNG